jgi:hypothetical protein
VTMIAIGVRKIATDCNSLRRYEVRFKVIGRQ